MNEIDKILNSRKENIVEESLKSGDDNDTESNAAEHGDDEEVEDKVDLLKKYFDIQSDSRSDESGGVDEYDKGKEVSDEVVSSVVDDVVMSNESNVENVDSSENTVDVNVGAEVVDNMSGNVSRVENDGVGEVLGDGVMMSKIDKDTGDIIVDAGGVSADGGVGAEGGVTGGQESQSDNDTQVHNSESSVDEGGVGRSDSTNVGEIGAMNVDMLHNLVKSVGSVAQGDAGVGSGQSANEVTNNGETADGQDSVAGGASWGAGNTQSGGLGDMNSNQGVRNDTVKKINVDFSGGPGGANEWDIPAPDANKAGGGMDDLLEMLRRHVPKK